MNFLTGQSIIVVLVVGLVAGWLAGKIMRGAGFGLIGDIIVGIVGALIGSWPVRLLSYRADRRILGQRHRDFDDRRRGPAVRDRSRPALRIQPARCAHRTGFHSIAAVAAGPFSNRGKPALASHQACAGGVGLLRSVPTVMIGHAIRWLTGFGPAHGASSRAPAEAYRRRRRCSSSSCSRACCCSRRPSISWRCRSPIRRGRSFPPSTQLNE